MRLADIVPAGSAQNGLARVGIDPQHLAESFRLADDIPLMSSESDGYTDLALPVLAMPFRLASCGAGRRVRRLVRDHGGTVFGIAGESSVVIVPARLDVS